MFYFHQELKKIMISSQARIVFCCIFLWEILRNDLMKKSIQIKNTSLIDYSILRRSNVVITICNLDGLLDIGAPKCSGS